MPIKIILFLLALSIFSCSTDYEFVESEELTIKKDGNQLEFLNKENNKISGNYRILYLPSDFGALWVSKLIEAEIVNGKLNGKVNVYVSDPGYKVSFENRKKDKIENDIVKEYSLLYKVLNYKNGQLNGTSTLYDNKSKPLLISEFKDGNMISFIGYGQKDRKKFSSNDAELNPEMIQKITKRLILDLKGN